MRNITVAQSTPVFTPITITINSKTELANILGAGLAYGTANTFAENSLKAIGLGENYSGNVRKASREFVTAVAEAASSANIDLDGLAALVKDYLNSYKFKGSRFSKAGSAVAGTDEDLSKGRDYDAGLEPALPTAMPVPAPVARW